MFLIAKSLTTLIYNFVKLFNLGNGYTLPGYIILKLFPNILNSKQFNYKKGIILVSGTNGKTTTSKLIFDILKTNNFSVINNSSGSNLLRGITTTLLLNTSILKNNRPDIAVLEVDEFVLPTLLTYITPKVLILLNLSRDQLDRYGETDTILNKWIDSLHTLSVKTTLILDTTQDISHPLSKEFKGTTLFFNDIKPSKVIISEYFNIKNINCALKVSSLYGLGIKESLGVVNNFEYAYGRGEKISYLQKFFTVYLAKNPASLNNNLELVIESKKSFDTVFFILNDNLPDGRDVSWIYDVDTTLLKKSCEGKQIFVSGTRCYDFATRLIYAGVNINPIHVNADLLVNLKNIESLETTKNVVVLPNYSSMLSFRKITVGKNIL